MEFGNTTNSRFLAQGKTTARAWALSKILDAKGNYFTVDYTNGTTNGEAYPIRIDYTGNSAAALTPYNSVRLVYAARTDHTRVYQAGSQVRTTNRLTNIQTYSGASLVLDYQLTYDQTGSSGRSRLTSIKLCDPSAVCLPATTFGWQIGIAPAVSNVAGNLSSPITPGVAADLTTYFGDWNEDGLTDIMVYKKSTGEQAWFYNTGIVGGNQTFALQSDPIAPASITGSTQLYFGDWNRDGHTDIMWYDKASGNQKWYISNGVVSGSISFVEHVNPIAPSAVTGGTALYFGDWNGDGRTDLMWHNASTGAHNMFINNGIVSSALNFAQYANPMGVNFDQFVECYAHWRSERRWQIGLIVD